MRVCAHGGDDERGTRDLVVERAALGEKERKDEQ